MNRLITPLLGIIAVVSITANVLQAKRWSDARPIVTVGSHEITRGEYMSTVDAVTQGSVLKTLVLRTAVMEAASKQGVLPTPDQIAERMTEVQEKQPELLDDSSQDEAKVEQNRDEIIAALALENLRIAGVDVSDADVSNYYSSHLQDFTIPKQVKTTLVITNDPVNTATAERLLGNGTPSGLIAAQPGMEVAGINSAGVDMNTLPADLRHQIQDAVFSMKQGEVKTFHDDRTALSYRIDVSNEAYVPPLSEIRDAVVRQEKLEKAPAAQTELAVAYHEASPKFDIPKYAEYFSDMADGGNVTTASLP